MHVCTCMYCTRKYAFVYLIFLLGYITGFMHVLYMHASNVHATVQCIIQYIHVCSLIHCVGDV